MLDPQDDSTTDSLAQHRANFRHNARAFADKWSKQTKEKQYAQSFWSDFAHRIFGIEDLLADGFEFEFPVKNHRTGTTNFIDALWNNIVLIEHKSAAKDLDDAEEQARDYLISLPAHLRPPVLLISDFARFRIVQVLEGRSVEFPLSDLPEHLDDIDAIFRATAAAFRTEGDADAKAARLMTNLYTELERAGYEGHDVSIFLTRILFLLFGDSTHMWKSRLFRAFVEASSPDGRGLGGQLNELFDVLATKKENRPSILPAELADFPYVNGGLFSEQIRTFQVSPEMREALLTASRYQWENISPAIFGAMFQTVKSKADRRELGEHYTSEKDILKVIRPLFLDDYTNRLTDAWDDAGALRQLQRDLGQRNYLDPAAGSGNFLIVSYKRLREIEHKVIARLQELEGASAQPMLGNLALNLSLEQFHAIEYEEWSSQLASVAMLLADHQMNLRLEEITGFAPNILPLKHRAKIHHGNALRVKWSDVCPMDDNTVIMGNPPFYSYRYLSPEQSSDQKFVWEGIKGSGKLDLVASWYYLAAKNLSGTQGGAAFVSTNSVTQGEQPVVMWQEMSKHGMSIDFAHRSFAWSNEAAGKAAVHCVIIGFSARKTATDHHLWSYSTVKSEPTLSTVTNINAYLLDAPNVLVTSRSKPLQETTPTRINGSMPNDGGYLSTISETEAEGIRKSDPLAAKYLRRLVGSEELISGKKRYCLWLVGANPADIANSKILKERVSGVRETRDGSKRAATRAGAASPTKFLEVRQPKTNYLAVPVISSDDRDYVPMSYFTAETVLSNTATLIENADLFTFGVLSSAVFTEWNRAISGRLGESLIVGISTAYNNFAFPQVTADVKSKVEAVAQAVLDARALYPENTLAELYGRNTMPDELRTAHKALDRAVLTAYGLSSKATKTETLAHLFAEYARLTKTAA